MGKRIHYVCSFLKERQKMDKKVLKFPDNFMWGGAGASEQMEGHGNTGKAKTGWDAAFEEHPE